MTCSHYTPFTVGKKRGGGNATKEHATLRAHSSRMELIETASMNKQTNKHGYVIPCWKFAVATAPLGWSLGTRSPSASEAASDTGLCRSLRQNHVRTPDCGTMLPPDLPAVQIPLIISIRKPAFQVPAETVLFPKRKVHMV